MWQRCQARGFEGLKLARRLQLPIFVPLAQNYFLKFFFEHFSIVD